MGDAPREVDEIYEDFTKRRDGILKALTSEVDRFYEVCEPERENLCLYGDSDGGWEVNLPAEEVPPELPEPCLGINFARDGMQRKDWLALVAVHSDAWLLGVAYYYGAKLDASNRFKLFRGINALPTIYEIVTGRNANARPKPAQTHAKRNMEDAPGNGMGAAQAAEEPLSTGRLLTYNDITPNLKGRQAELYWPDDQMWYLVEINAVNTRSRTAKIQYTSGEVEELNMDEIVREGHMSLITQ